MRLAYEEDETEALLLIDAENAFNRLNRGTALHNIKQLCPPFHRYLQNTYRDPAKLFFGDGSFIESQEGVTQGDNAAMAMYAVATRPLTDRLTALNPDIRQVWFADDSTAGGSVKALRKYWDAINEIGPGYGYNPKATKSYLILKNPRKLAAAKKAFRNVEIQITTDGERHLGAAIGTDDFR